MDALAITIKADGLLNRIISPVTIQQAEAFCKPRDISLKQIEVRAMWDTGSTGCCISQKLAEYLELISIASLDLTSVHDSKPSSIYLLDMIFPDKIKANNVLAAEIIPSGEFDIIIGMNIISLGDFAITNDHGKTTMSFRLPAANVPIDFSRDDYLL
jgi:hypothetical protein